LKNAKRTLEDELKVIGDSETKLLREQEKLEQRGDNLLKRQRNEIFNEPINQQE